MNDFIFKDYLEVVECEMYGVWYRSYRKDIPLKSRRWGAGGISMAISEFTHVSKSIHGRDAPNYPVITECVSKMGNMEIDGVVEPCFHLIIRAFRSAESMKTFADYAGRRLGIKI